MTWQRTVPNGEGETMQSTLSRIAVVVVLAASAAGAVAADTKDIVLDRITAAAVPVRPGVPAPVTVAGDAMIVSVLLESPNGTLTPKSTQTLFRTGDRFRVKVLASREGRISFYNTNPRGQTDSKPLWQGEVRPGLETISPRLALTGTSGIDKLHVVLEPMQQPSGVFSWLTRWLSPSKDDVAKDIRLDVQSTPSTTYLLNTMAQGIVSTVQIVHTR
jgi:hypothetical protein